MNKSILLGSAFLFVFGGILHAQKKLVDIDFNQVQQRKVRKLVKRQYVDGVRYFQELKSMCFLKENSENYKFHELSNIIEEDVNASWNRTKHIRPQDLFDGDMVSFGFMYSRRLDSIIYPNDKYVGLEVGQIIYLNLKLLRGLSNLGVALEITEFDEENHVIHFCYVDHGKSQGTQEVHFVPTEDGLTEVKQITHYKSKSDFRDKKLYPRFHEIAIMEMHRNLKYLIEGGSLFSNFPKKAK